MKRLLVLLAVAGCVPVINSCLWSDLNDRMNLYYEVVLLDKINPLRFYDSDYSLTNWYIDNVATKEHLHNYGK